MEEKSPSFSSDLILALMVEKMDDFGELSDSFTPNLKMDRDDAVLVLWLFADLGIKSSIPKLFGLDASAAAAALIGRTHHFPAFLTRSSSNRFLIFLKASSRPFSYCSYLYGDSRFMSWLTCAKNDWLVLLFDDRHLMERCCLTSAMRRGNMNCILYF